ncbi:MAG: hypothetical protein AAGH78_00630 [Cyanobacteria bacterium P01_H01_bin.58]
MEQKPTPESFTDYAWIFIVSDKGVTLKFSSEVMESLGKQLRVALPWLLAVLTTFVSGTAGVKFWLLEQPETPATFPTEEIAPQRKGD